MEPAACNWQPTSEALPLKADLGTRPKKISVFQVQERDDVSRKVRDQGKEGESRRQMDESGLIHGKLGFPWENLKPSSCGMWKLNSQHLIKHINYNHKGISQLVPQS